MWAWLIKVEITIYNFNRFLNSPNGILRRIQRQQHGLYANKFFQRPYCTGKATAAPQALIIVVNMIFFLAFSPLVATLMQFPKHFISEHINKFSLGATNTLFIAQLHKYVNIRKGKKSAPLQYNATACSCLQALQKKTNLKLSILP